MTIGSLITTGSITGGVGTFVVLSIVVVVGLIVVVEGGVNVYDCCVDFDGFI